MSLAVRGTALRRLGSAPALAALVGLGASGLAALELVGPGVVGPGLVGLLVAGSTLAGCGGPTGGANGTTMPDPLQTVAADELFRRGLALSEASDFVRAEQYFVAALERGHPEDEVMMPLVVACVRSDRLSAALRHAEPYLSRHPGAWALRLVVATVQMALGEHQRARDELVQITRDAPREPSAYYMLGVLSREQLDDDAMRMNFSRYLELEPEGPHAAEARAALATPLTSPSASGAEATGTGPVRLAPHGEAPSGTASTQGGNGS